MKNMIINEQIRKKVNKSGNGGAVWVPKEWLGEEILVTRIETPKLSLKEEIIHLFLPQIENISGIFIYGSYARKEETANSDIDILVLAKNKFDIKNTKKLDIGIIEVKKIKDLVQKNIFIYSIINESKPIINAYLLEELKNSDFDIKNFKDSIDWFKETTQDSIKSTKEFIELDKMESKYVLSYSIIYSLILRLRGLFLIYSILNNKKFSNKSFKQWISKCVSDKEFKKIYWVYRNIRDNKKVNSIKITLEQAESLLNFLSSEVNKLNGK